MYQNVNIKPHRGSTESHVYKNVSSWLLLSRGVMKLASAFSFLNPVPSGLTAEEAAFCSHLIAQKNRYVGIIAYRAALAFQLASLVTDQLIFTQLVETASNLKTLRVLTSIHILVIILSTLALVFGKKHDRWLSWPSVPTIALLFAGYAMALFTNIYNNRETFDILLSAMSTLAMGIFIVQMSAYGTAKGPAILCSVFAGTMAWAFYEIDRGGVLGILTCAIFLYTFAVKCMQISGRWLAARSEFRETKRAAEVEKARNQHEMNLASAIQDSHRRRTALSTNSLKVDFFMLKHATVGGDWCAADSRRDGSLLVLMIDAAGKGMQAALVVHAVQSIWTAACHDEFFEAGSWIQRLNNVLVEMGRGSPHAVALGLAKVERDKLTYWCAGLGPIYVRRDLEGGADIRSHTGRGTMLGIQASEEIAIKPIVVDLDTTKPSMVFFGTDGVLVGMRKRDKAIIEQFVDILPEHAEERLRTIPIEDDKALVRITITPTVKPKQLSA